MPVCMVDGFSGASSALKMGDVMENREKHEIQSHCFGIRSENEVWRGKRHAEGINVSHSMGMLE